MSINTKCNMIYKNVSVMVKGGVTFTFNNVKADFVIKYNDNVLCVEESPKNKQYFPLENILYYKLEQE